MMKNNLNTKVYLYVKELNGIKYFGKTVQRDPFAYSGSGSYWRRIVKKYGKQNIKTLEVFGFDDINEAKEFAIKFSKDNNIVSSKQWANLVPEHLAGGDTSASENYKLGMAKRIHGRLGPMSEEMKAKLRKPKKNKENYKGSKPGNCKNYIYVHNSVIERKVPLELFSQLQSQGFVKGRLLHTCSKCNKSMDWQNFQKYHKNCSNSLPSQT